MNSTLCKMRNMKYKTILKEYKKYQAERTKRCGVLFKALEHIPEPTDEQLQRAYERLLDKGRISANDPNPVVDLECLVEYLQQAIEPKE